MAAADQAPEAGPLPEEEPPAQEPEGIPPSGNPPGIPPGLAEPGQRLLARIVDTLVVGFPVVVVVREIVPATDVDVAAPPAVAGFLLLYEWIQLALWGRTIGKRFAGIEVVRRPAPGSGSEPSEPSEGPPEGPPEGESERAGGVHDTNAAEGEQDVSERAAAVSEDGRLGVGRSLLRTAAYALPIAARPVPVFGVIAGLFWVGNAALMYEGVRRQALHDRLTGTAVVKRGAVPS